MNSNHPIYLGVMSGTSLDGVDVVAFTPHNNALIAAHSVDFSTDLRNKALVLQQASNNELHHAQLVSNELADLYARAVNEIIAQANLNKDHIQAVGVHGQTIRHRPDLGYTVQLNQPARIAEQTGLNVVSDFRARDIAAGGQGAPLVPAFHDALWRDAAHNRVALNIGGFANISVLNVNEPTFGFDTGPGNVLMDAWIQLNRGVNYDQNGDWAASGTIHDGLLNAFWADAFFHQPHPKSTGRDFFNLDWLQTHLKGFNAIKPADVQATLCALTVRSIAAEIKRASPNAAQIIVCGGGAFNLCLLNALKAALPNANIQTASAHGITPQSVEAAAFAWLAARTINHLSGNLPAVTGAAGERILGSVTFAG
jgi:anhydro-N-acetylmuramic acid kinase